MQIEARKIIAAYARTASRALKKRLKDSYSEIEPIMQRDLGASTQYSQVIEALLNEVPVWDDQQLKQWNACMIEIDRIQTELRKKPRLFDRLQYRMDSEDDQVQTFREALDREHRELKRSIKEYGWSDKADLEVHNDRIVETKNFEAACRMHGALAPKSRQRPWCGGGSRANYKTYGGPGKRRFIVFPRGPDKRIVVGPHEDVPWSSYAFTISVDSKGALNNINDYQNRYFNRDEDFDIKGAKEAIELLNQALGYSIEIKRDSAQRQNQHAYDLIADAVTRYYTDRKIGKSKFIANYHGDSNVFIFSFNNLDDEIEHTTNTLFELIQLEAEDPRDLLERSQLGPDDVSTFIDDYPPHDYTEINYADARSSPEINFDWFDFIKNIAPKIGDTIKTKDWARRYDDAFSTLYDREEFPLDFVTSAQSIDDLERLVAAYENETGDGDGDGDGYDT